MAASFEYQPLRYLACEYFAFRYKDWHVSMQDTVFDIWVCGDYPVHFLCVLRSSVSVGAVTRECVILVQLCGYILLCRLVLSEQLLYYSDLAVVCKENRWILLVYFLLESLQIIFS
jgi:hypothetical protein